MRCEESPSGEIPGSGRSDTDHRLTAQLYSRSRSSRRKTDERNEYNTSSKFRLRCICRSNKRGQEGNRRELSRRSSGSHRRCCPTRIYRDRWLQAPGEPVQEIEAAAGAGKQHCSGHLQRLRRQFVGYTHRLYRMETHGGVTMPTPEPKRWYELPPKQVTGLQRMLVHLHRRATAVEHRVRVLELRLSLPDLGEFLRKSLG